MTQANREVKSKHTCWTIYVTTIRQGLPPGITTQNSPSAADTIAKLDYNFENANITQILNGREKWEHATANVLCMLMTLTRKLHVFNSYPFFLL